MFGDQYDHARIETEPVVLVLDGEGLVGLMYDLEDYSDGGERCDWENEIACWSATDPLDDVLIDIHSVPDDCTKPYFDLPSYEERRDAYKPVGSRLTEYELRSIGEMAEQLEEGQITDDQADQVAAALSRRMLLVRSGSGVGRATG